MAAQVEDVLRAACAVDRRLLAAIDRLVDDLDRLLQAEGFAIR
jgi:hypothetical protein